MRNWHEEEEALGRELARRHYEADIGRPTHHSSPPSVVDWVERYLDRRFRDQQTYGHLRGKNIALHYDDICEMCEARGWRTTSISPDEIIVFGGVSL